jgi:hypothetical protein
MELKFTMESKNLHTRIYTAEHKIHGKFFQKGTGGSYL